MKITIDTDTKTVHVSEELPIGKLYEWIKSMFPEDCEDWKVVSDTKIQLTPGGRLHSVLYRPKRGGIPYTTYPAPYLQPMADPNPPHWEVTCKSDD